MGLCDPAQILVRHSLLSQTVPKHLLYGEIEIHVTASVDSSDQLENATEEGVTCARERLEADILAFHVRTIKEAQIFAINPFQFGVTRQFLT